MSAGAVWRKNKDMIHRDFHKKSTREALASWVLPFCDGYSVAVASYRA